MPESVNRRGSSGPTIGAMVGLSGRVAMHRKIRGQSLETVLSCQPAYGRLARQVRRARCFEMEGHKRTSSFYASPEEARRQPPEELVYVACLYQGTGIEEPDFIAVVDVNPESDTYSQIVHRTPMPNVGDELHHYGWNTCSSSHDCCHSQRSHLIVPGFRSSRIHILDVASDPRKPQIVKVIEPEEVKRKTGYSAPHTVHCMPGGIITISMQ